MHHIDGSFLVPKRLTKNRFRRAIIEAWGGCCAYCEAKPEKITLDHVIPKVDGGQTARANLVPACAPCNVAKNHCNVWEWYQNQPWHTQAREDRIRQWIEQGENPSFRLR